MDLRNLFILSGFALIFTSFWLGDWAIILGAPLIFLGIIFKFLDVS